MSIVCCTSRSLSQRIIYVRKRCGVDHAQQAAFEQFDVESTRIRRIIGYSGHHAFLQ